MSYVWPFVSDYIWQNEPFCLDVEETTIDHLHPHHRRCGVGGTTMFGDNIEDEWFIVSLLFIVSLRFQHVACTIWDNDGQFLLIEAGCVLDDWMQPDVMSNRVFIHKGKISIVPPSPQNPGQILALSTTDHSITNVFLASERRRRRDYDNEEENLATTPLPTITKDSIKHSDVLMMLPLRIAICVLASAVGSEFVSKRITQVVVQRINGYPEKGLSHQFTKHTAICAVPLMVKRCLERNKQLISAAVNALFYRDPFQLLQHCEKNGGFRSSKR
jgi:hypothetical protein